MNLTFTKVESLANDFVVLDRRAITIDDDALPKLAHSLCDRRRGIGADGLLVLDTGSGDTAAHARIINNDGSQGGMCVNGFRCLGGMLANSHGETFHLAVGARTLRITTEGDHVFVTVDAPAYGHADIPFDSSSAEPAEGGLHLVGRLAGLPVSMGNPHFVAPVETFASGTLESRGHRVSTHHAFPEGANVHLVRFITRDRAEMRTWERGVGPTLACGSGAAAVLAAGLKLGALDAQATIDAPGGPSIARMDDDGSISIGAPWRTVFQGTIEIPD